VARNHDQARASSSKGEGLVGDEEAAGSLPAWSTKFGAKLWATGDRRKIAVTEFDSLSLHHLSNSYSHQASKVHAAGC
jgi:hypothetical protein